MLAKAVKGAEISILVGVSAALLATLIGTVLHTPFWIAESARLNTAAKVKISRMPGIEVNTL